MSPATPIEIQEKRMDALNFLIISKNLKDIRLLHGYGHNLGFIVQTANSPDKILKKAPNIEPHLVLIDVEPDLFQAQLLQDILQNLPKMGIIFLVEQFQSKIFQGLPHNGLWDYMLKPIAEDDFTVITRRLIRRLREIRGQEDAAIKEEARSPDFSEIIGASPQILHIFHLIKKIAHSKITILITGETGTGKELFAKAIHNNSPRNRGNFVPVNCAAIAPNLLESEFFGHKRGSFTNAVEDKVGLFEKAHNGTLFLDEIGDLPLDLQVKILRAIQEEEIRRVGDNRAIQVDVRIVSATNKNLEDAVKNGLFREDLYFRLNVVHLHIPPLRERKDDVITIARHFIQKFAQREHKRARDVTDNASAMLKNYTWPGNVRELSNAIEQTILFMEDKEIIDEACLPEFLERRRFEIRDRFKREMIDKKLSIEEYTKAFIVKFQDELTEKELAQFLGITTKTLWEKRQKWKLPRSRKLSGTDTTEALDL
jgi:DNA-binding NtrC family response regulator